MEKGKHIMFVPGPSKPKTKTWAIHSIDQPGIQLGWVCWYGHWRKYGFFPDAQTVFEQDCLRDIAAFIEKKTREHMLAKKSTAKSLPGA